MDKFAQISTAEQTVNQNPSEKQAKAGNYRKGYFRWNGLKLAVENPYNSTRKGKGWETRMGAQYGYIKETLGADGDCIDYFMGYYPESDCVYIVNQLNDNGTFDEHKCLLGFPDIQSASNAYKLSYDKPMKHAGIIEFSVSEFKNWIKNADKMKPAQKDRTMTATVNWRGGDTPHTFNDKTGRFEVVAPAMLRYLTTQQGSKDASLLTEAVSFDSIYGDADEVIEEGIVFDALVLENRLIVRRMNALRRVMSRTGSELHVVGEAKVSKPIRKNGSVHIAVVFDLSDGQTITIYFHNPDTTPNKLKPNDELISWKWLLNRRDITIVVAPERGKDIELSILAERIIKVAETNTKAFSRFNAKAKERVSEIESLEKEIAEKEKRLDRIQKDIDIETEVNKELKSKIDTEAEKQAEKAKKADFTAKTTGTIYKGEFTAKINDILGGKTLVALEHTDGTAPVFKTAKSNRGAKMIRSRYEKENSNLSTSYIFDAPYKGGFGGRSDILTHYVETLGLTVKQDEINPELLATAKVKTDTVYYVPNSLGSGGYKATVKGFDTDDGETLFINFITDDGALIVEPNKEYPLWDDAKNKEGDGKLEKELNRFKAVVAIKKEKRGSILDISSMPTEKEGAQKYFSDKITEAENHNNEITQVWRELIKKTEGINGGVEAVEDMRELRNEAEINIQLELSNPIREKFTNSVVESVLETKLTKDSSAQRVLAYFLAKQGLDSSDKQLDAFAEKMANKDMAIYGILKSKSNKASRQAFEYLTGLTLPSNSKDLDKFLQKEWRGLSDAEIEQENKGIEAEASKMELEKAFKDLQWTGVTGNGLKDEVLSDNIANLIKSGFNKITTTKKGAVTYYTISDKNEILKIQDRYANKFLKMVESMDGGFKNPIVKSVIFGKEANTDKALFNDAIKAITRIQSLEEMSQEISKLIENIESAEGFTLDMFESEIMRAQNELMKRMGYDMEEIAQKVA